MNPSIPQKCNGCGEPLLLENIYAEDGCGCNTPLGVNFHPKPCTICKQACSRPAHRLKELFNAP